LKGGGLSGDWKFRIIIPIILNHSFVSITSRTILEGEKQRYKTLSNDKSILSAKDTLYNYDNCISDVVIITEGPFDAMRIGDCCVATLGTGMTSAQRKLLFRFKRIFFLYDPELRAQERAEQQAAMIASVGKDVHVVDLGGSCDPGDLSEDDVKHLRKELLNENS
jgi:DNA primase